MTAKVYVKLLTILTVLLLVQAPGTLVRLPMPRRRSHQQNAVTPFLFTPQEKLSVLLVGRPSIAGDGGVDAA